MKKNNFETKNNDFKKTVEEFSNMNENELKNMMFNYAKKEINNGTLDNSKLEDFYNKASAFLGSNEKQTLRELIDSIKI